MPMYAGLDIGSRTTKAAIFDDNDRFVWTIIDTEPEIELTAKKVFSRVMDKAGVSTKDVAGTVATGYGRVVVSFAHSVTEISCHARGAVYFNPEIRLILDVGGQDSKAIRCNQEGKVTAFALNEKCAAGTGRYLERVAETLGIPLEQIGPLSLKATQPVEISSFCAVFAQNEVVSLLRSGKPLSDILAGACYATIRRQVPLLKKVGLEGGTLMFCGGVAKNAGAVKVLEEQVGMKAYIPPEPQIVGAVGAALIARERARKGQPVVILP
ncbi:MAG: 2-hydroxyglutaryl-CoA dehydratase [Chloroflexi bacterium]|nr:2-hydroxyglutaryl-CoA dehydratase [Chloroflexota bacterium]